MTSLVCSKVLSLYLEEVQTRDIRRPGVRASSCILDYYLQLVSSRSLERSLIASTVSSRIFRINQDQTWVGSVLSHGIHSTIATQTASASSWPRVGWGLVQSRGFVCGVCFNPASTFYFLSFNPFFLARYPAGTAEDLPFIDRYPTRSSSMRTFHQQPFLVGLFAWYGTRSYAPRAFAGLIHSSFDQEINKRSYDALAVRLRRSFLLVKSCVLALI